MLFVNCTEKYLGGVAGSGATVLLEDWFQLGEGSGADIRTDAIVMLNQNLLLLTWCTITFASHPPAEEHSDTVTA